MYGEGGKVGPDLTGSGRADLDYLLENIIDPSAVVAADYRMSLVTLKDYRTLAGVVAAENPRTLTLRLATEDQSMEKSEVVSREVSPCVDDARRLAPGAATQASPRSDRLFTASAAGRAARRVNGRAESAANVRMASILGGGRSRRHFDQAACRRA
ncbi:MAG: hypothetical protein R3F11_20130 [Verrucomicrobiales bacterium]